MAAVGKLLAYVVWTVCGGALLAPVLWWAARGAIERGWLVDVLGEFGFAKYLNRAVLLAALVGLVPFLRWLGVRRWEDLGLRTDSRRALHLAAGLGVGAIGLWAAGGVVLLLDRATLRDVLPWHKLVTAALTAAAVAPLEELFFRGALLGVLRRELGARRAVVVLSLVFAALHFVRPRKHAVPDEITVTSGFAMLPSVFASFADFQLLMGSLTTLFLVGVCLAYSVERTRSLYLAVGLHAGWVFALRSFGYFTKRQGSPSWWMGRDLLTGMLPVALLGLTLAGLWWALRERTAPLSSDEPRAPAT